MNMENGYLTDAELEALILEVEENELVSAPPDFVDVISEKIGGLQEEKKRLTHEIGDLSYKDVMEMQKKKTVSQERKVREFHRYCIRVITSAAAAIAIVFALPNAEWMKLPKEEVLTREELVGESISREEVLDDTGFLTKLMNGLNSKTGGFLNETEKEK